jgi:hypothetical protein
MMGARQVPALHAGMHKLDDKHAQNSWLTATVYYVNFAATPRVHWTKQSNLEL